MLSRMFGAPAWRDLRAAWLHAAKDLGIDVVAPFSASGEGQLEIVFPVLVRSFGNQLGTIVLPLNAQALAEHAKQLGYFVSNVNEQSYASYERQLFVDTLDDWGYFGSSRPSWYTGKPWS